MYLHRALTRLCETICIFFVYVYIYVYLTIILRGRAGYRMIDNQRGA